MGEETSTIIIKDGANIEILLVRYRFAESEGTKTFISNLQWAVGTAVISNTKDPSSIPVIGHIIEQV